MATVIRMKRGGRTHKPYYRIVVQDSRTRIRGPEIDTIGVYHPIERPEPRTEVDMHKALAWLRKGAQPSDTVRTVFRKTGVMKHFRDGTTPEEPITVAKDAAVEEKGYNAPPEPKEEAPVSAAGAESAAEDAAGERDPEPGPGE